MAKTNVVKIDVEPSYSKEETASQLEIAEALSWYHSNKSEKDAAKYLSVDVKIAKNNLTYAWLTRMLSRGFKFGEKSEETIVSLKDRFKVYCSSNKKSDLDEDGNVIVAPVINLQERIAAKTDAHIGELEGMIDEYGDGKKTFNAYDWFTKNDVKPIHAAKIIDYFQKRLDQFTEESKSKDTREYYEGLSKARLKSIAAVMSVIITDAERLSQNVGKTRKPRKKKPVSFEKQVSKIKYKDKDADFKIQSINPVEIVGSQQLWVFNTKTRKLGVYNALDASGLFVKGSTITNYSDSSNCKTLRKPEQVLTSLLNGGKITLRKLMDGINAKSAPLNGRINKDTVLLRVVRT